MWDDEPIRAAMPWDNGGVGALGPEPAGAQPPLGSPTGPPASPPAREPTVSNKGRDSAPQLARTTRSSTRILWTEGAVLQELQATASARGAHPDSGSSAPLNGSCAPFSFQAAALEVQMGSFHPGKL